MGHHHPTRSDCTEGGHSRILEIESADADKIHQVAGGMAGTATHGAEGKPHSADTCCSLLSSSHSSPPSSPLPPEPPEPPRQRLSLPRAPRAPPTAQERSLSLAPRTPYTRRREGTHLAQRSTLHLHQPAVRLVTTIWTIPVIPTVHLRPWGAGEAAKIRELHSGAAERRQCYTRATRAALQ